jgi:hypothetical protein
MHGRYVSQAHLFQSIYHTLDYGRALASGVEGSQPQLLGDLLAKVHNDVTTFWNFIDQQNVRYFCGVMAYTLIRSPVRSSAVKRSRTSYSSLSRTLKNHEISINPGPTPCHGGMCRYNGVEWNVIIFRSSKAIEQISQDLEPITDAHPNKVPTFTSTDFLKQLRSDVLVKEYVFLYVCHSFSD